MSAPATEQISATIAPAPPVGLLAELTHRCPLQCPYCSNPLELESIGRELDTAEWIEVLSQAADLGVLQLHLSGGEPTVRGDLEAIVAHAAKSGLYCNLITSGVLLDAERLARLVQAGLNHVQISLQDTDAANADRLGRYVGAHAKKLALARAIKAAGLILTLNVPIHRQNIASVPAFIDLAITLGARRLEVAHVQYYGWALANRAALMPSREQVMETLAIVETARELHKGVLTIDFVVPDYYASRPKPCMGGWGRGIINITPSGLVLPCHAAQTLPGLTFESCRDRPLAAIWRESSAFQMFRGTAWMAEPCCSCDLRTRDWGGCRCQAYAITGSAENADPACAKSELHSRFVEIAVAEASASAPSLIFRNPRSARGLR